MGIAAAASSGVLPKGAVIGRYLVLALVGRGGMGEVYAAYDPELDRKIAVKLLRGNAAGTQDPEGRVRLLREAQAIAKLSHPNVVVVYDVGTFKDSVFIAMEFVEGNTVGYWLQAERRPWPEVLKVFGAAGRGLLAAHTAGMVHRDFKPDNVMLTKDGQVRVMDFGLARRVFDEAPPVMTQSTDTGRMQHLLNLGEAAAAAAAQVDGVDMDATAKLGGAGAAAPSPASTSGSFLNQKLTQTGALVGTPAYMAPEQFAGAATDARTDQFSFCVALYEALYGQRPFDGDSVVTLMTNVISGTVRDEPQGTTVPSRIRKVLLQGLEADPDKRHVSMSELLAELEKDPTSRRRIWLAAAAATTLGLALIVGVQQLSVGRRALCEGAGDRLAGIWELVGDSPRKQTIGKAFATKGQGNTSQLFAGVSGLLDSYVGRWASMYRESCEATHVRGEQSAEVLDLRMSCLTQRLSGVKALTDIFSSADKGVIENAVNAVAALPNLERCADVAMLRSVIQPPSDQQARQRVEAIRTEIARARALGDAGQCAPALAAGRAALASAIDIGYLPLKAEAHYVNGRSGNFCLDGPTAIESLEEAVWAAEASHHDEVAVEASGFAAVLYAERMRDPRTARRWTHHAEAILKRLPGHPMLEAYNSVSWGMVFLAEGNNAEAVRQQQRALELKEQALGPLHPDTAVSSMNVGVALHELGRDADAEPYASRAVTTFERLLGAEGVQLATALLDQGEVLAALGRNQEARQALSRARSIWQKSGASPFFVAYAQFDLARVAMAEKRSSEARALLEGAIELLGQQDQLMGAQARFLLAEALWETPRDRGRAISLAREAKKHLAAMAAPPSKTAEVDAWLQQHATM